MINNEMYYILSRNIELPRPLNFGGRIVTNFLVKNYLSNTVLDAIEESGFKDEPIEGGSSEWGEMVGKTSVIRNGGATELSIGKIFKTKLIAMEGSKEAVPVDQ
ncbi:hypothetical protein [Azospirillum oryzae]|uniref:hypothetical protein n=1 Tax=Azospirillum oryzae TaxID=286727 RepID=UPI0011ED6A3E|nr:hypothetical protein [Azospirillum oryzae]KAA0591110.1 hypothetical protein FZ938_03180 [Azospirillum oryzae]